MYPSVPVKLGMPTVLAVWKRRIVTENCETVVPPQFQVVQRAPKVNAL